MSEIVGDEIRRFSDDKIQEAVARALTTLPSDKKGAVVAYANLDGVKLAVVARPGEHWSIAGVLDKPYHKPLQAEAAVVYSW